MVEGELTLTSNAWEITPNVHESFKLHVFQVRFDGPYELGLEHCRKKARIVMSDAIWPKIGALGIWKYRKLREEVTQC